MEKSWYLLKFSRIDELVNSVYMEPMNASVAEKISLFLGGELLREKIKYFLTF